MQKTLKSIEEQTVDGGFEHIIIDGASTDQSVRFIEKYKCGKNNVIFLSEKDSGIYSAMNKGLFLANGKMVAFLNSGDVLASNDVLCLLSEFSSKFSKYDIIYSDLQIVNSDGIIVRNWKSGEYSWSKVLLGWMIPHPMTLIKTPILKNLNGFNEELRIASDYDLLLRALCIKNIQIQYLEICSVKMDNGGVSNGSLKNILYANFEVMQSWKKLNGFLLPYWIFISKPLSKLIQLRKL